MLDFTRLENGRAFLTCEFGVCFQDRFPSWLLLILSFTFSWSGHPQSIFLPSFIFSTSTDYPAYDIC